MVHLYRGLLRFCYHLTCVSLNVIEETITTVKALGKRLGKSLTMNTEYKGRLWLFFFVDSTIVTDYY